jgi:hypothetical protein
LRYCSRCWGSHSCIHHSSRLIVLHVVPLILLFGLVEMLLVPHVSLALNTRDVVIILHLLLWLVHLVASLEFFLVPWGWPVDPLSLVSEFLRNRLGLTRSFLAESAIFKIAVFVFNASGEPKSWDLLVVLDHTVFIILKLDLVGSVTTRWSTVVVMLTLIQLVSVMMVLLVWDRLFSMMTRRRSVSLTTLGSVMSPPARMVMMLLPLTHLPLFATSSSVRGNPEELRVLAHGSLTFWRWLKHFDVVLRFAETDEELSEVLE